MVVFLVCDEVSICSVEGEHQTMESQWVVMGIWRSGLHNSSLSSRASCKVGGCWICLANGGMSVVMIATCCWWIGHGFGEVWVSLFTRAMGPGVGGRGGSMGTG